MASGIFKNVTRSEPCPVCGGTDWCSWFPRRDGDGYLLLCKRACRDGYGSSDVAGKDGRMYCFISEKNNQYIYGECQADRGHFKENREKPKERFRYVGKVRPAGDTTLDCVYRTILKKLHLEDRHREYLHGEGWSDSMIERSLIKSFPESDYARANGYSPGGYSPTNLTRKELAENVLEELGISSLKGVPGAYFKENDNGKGYWTFSGASGLLLPVFNHKGEVFRLRIRMDYMGIRKCSLVNGIAAFTEGDSICYLDMSGPYRNNGDTRERVKLDDFSGKMRPFQSFYAVPVMLGQGIIKNTYKYGCESKNHASYYYKGGDCGNICLITEGEKKGQYANFRLNIPVWSLPGVNSYGLLFEKDRSGRTLLDYTPEGKKTIFVVAFDADKHTNKTVMSYQEALVSRLKESGYIAATADWDVSHGKGIDDLLYRGYIPKFNLK